MTFVYTTGLITHRTNRGDTRMEQLQTFLNTDYADEVLIVLGAVLVFFSVIKIVSSSLKMVFWVLLAGVGTVLFSYGFQQSPFDLPLLDSSRLPSLAEISSGADSELLRFLCQRLEQVTGG